MSELTEALDDLENELDNWFLIPLAADAGVNDLIELDKRMDVWFKKVTKAVKQVREAAETGTSNGRT